MRERKRAAPMRFTSWRPVVVGLLLALPLSRVQDSQPDAPGAIEDEHPKRRVRRDGAGVRRS